jgi:hypothetical protein
LAVAFLGALSMRMERLAGCALLIPSFVVDREKPVKKFSTGPIGNVAFV